jgi:RNA polymerase sigma factor (sigma-70 family)
VADRELFAIVGQVVDAVHPDPDTARFERLFDRHAAELLRYCFRRTADAALAEDLVSAVFLEAWRRRGVLQRDGDARPWLYGIATNLVRHQWRSRRRHAAALARIADGREDGEPADEVLARQHEMRAVLADVAQLPRREQDVLALCVWSGLSYEDAAHALRLPVGTVRSRLSRARERLRETRASGATLAPRPERNIP